MRWIAAKSMFLLMPLWGADGLPARTDESVGLGIEPLTLPVIDSGAGKQIGKPASVDWKAIARQSGVFLGIQHSFRLATEYDTRNAGRPMVRGYFQSVRNLHGWSDGDPAYVNYLGHPMQGAVSGYIWTQNDPQYGSMPFSKDPRYWKGRLRATGFAALYSAQFELGPVSEASIGNIQAKYPQQGVVDLVITPAAGLGWMVAEDAIERFLLIPLERRVANRYVRILARGFLTPSRSMANMVAGRVPYHRDDRSIADAWPADPKPPAFTPPAIDETDGDGIAPFELTVAPSYRMFPGSNANCGTGGGAEAAVRLSNEWQFVFDVNGCALRGLPQYVSGDALEYMMGPRWRPSANRLRPYAQVLVGGVKLTTEEVSPKARKAIELAARTNGNVQRTRDEYVNASAVHGFAISAGSGIDLRVARAAAIKLAGIEYTRSWAGGMNGVDYNRGLELKLGLTLRMGNW